MLSIKSLLSWALIVILFSGCSSMPVPVELQTTAAGDASLKLGALNAIFTSSISKDAIAAIKRSNITIQWSNPIYGGGKAFGGTIGSAICAVTSNCKFYAMVGKVNNNTNIIIGLWVHKSASGTKISVAGGQVIQKRALSSNRTQISGVDLFHKRAAYGEIDVPAGQLTASRITGTTARLAAIGPIKGYRNLGELLTVSTSGGLRTASGTPVLPCYRYMSDSTPTCGGGGGGTITPAPPVPSPPPPECEEVNCDSKRRLARAGAWKVVGGYATAAGSVATAVGGCVAAVSGPGTQPLCAGAVALGIGGVAAGGALIIEGENAKQEYEDCLEDQLSSNC